MSAYAGQSLQRRKEPGKYTICGHVFNGATWMPEYLLRSARVERANQAANFIRKCRSLVVYKNIS